MSRPVPITQWATPGTNYASGAFPWSGSPVNVAPVYTFFTPRGKAAAQEMNYLLSQATLGLNQLMDQVGQLDGVNWGLGAFPWSGLPGTSGTVLPPTFSPGAYDVHSGRWITALDAGSASTPRYRPYESADGQSWTPINTVSMTAGADGVASLASGRTVICQYDAGHVAVILPGAESWGEYVVNAGGSALGHSCIGVFNNQFVLAYHLTSGSAPVLQYSADGVTWTAGTGSFATESGGNNGGVFTSSSSLCILGVKDNGSKYYTSTDGHAWTQRTIPNSNTQFLDCTYDSVTNTFYMLAAVSLPAVDLLKSNDGVNWTVVRSFLTNLPLNVFSSGTMLLMAIKSFMPSTNCRVVYSVDGGTTFRFTGLSSPGDTFKFASNTAQILASDGTRYAASLMVGPMPVVSLV